MEGTSKIGLLEKALNDELQHRLLPYWVEYAVDEEYGGFVGRVRQDGNGIAMPPKVRC